MSREAARTAVMSAIQTLAATWVAYPLLVEYENRTVVNLSTQDNPYLCVDLVYISAEQAELSRSPRHRAFGHIKLTVHIKKGQGVKPANDLLEHFFVPLQQSDTLGPVRTFAADFVRATERDGWMLYPVLVPFYCDTVY